MGDNNVFHEGVHIDFNNFIKNNCIFGEKAQTANGDHYSNNCTLGVFFRALRRSRQCNVFEAGFTAGDYCKIHGGCHFGKNVSIGVAAEFDTDVSVGDDCTIGRNVTVAAEVEIGKKCKLGDCVQIGYQANINDQAQIPYNKKVNDGVNYKSKASNSKDNG